MKNAGTMQVTTPSEREIAMTRVFNAPRSLVFDAWTKPELLKRWLGVRGGWSFAVCEVDLKVGGAYRFVWRGPDGTEMGMGVPMGRQRRAARIGEPQSALAAGSRSKEPKRLKGGSDGRAPEKLWRRRLTRGRAPGPRRETPHASGAG